MHARKHLCIGTRWILQMGTPLVHAIEILWIALRSHLGHVDMGILRTAGRRIGAARSDHVGMARHSRDGAPATGGLQLQLQGTRAKVHRRRPASPRCLSRRR
jgi:hypothetical protein